MDLSSDNEDVNMKRKREYDFCKKILTILCDFNYNGSMNIVILTLLCLKVGSVVKNLPASAGATGDEGSIPVSGRSPGVGNGNPLQYSWLENSTDRGVSWSIVNGVAKSGT